MKEKTIDLDAITKRVVIILKVKMILEQLKVTLIIRNKIIWKTVFLNSSKTLIINTITVQHSPPMENL